MKLTRVLFDTRRTLWILLTMGALLVVSAVVAGKVWQRYGPKKPVLTEVQKDLVGRWIPQVLADLKEKRGTNTTAIILHLANDPSDYLTDTLRAEVQRTGYLTVNPKTWTTVLQTADEELQRAMNLQVTSPESLDKACARARGMGAPLVVFGKVHRLEGTSTEARLDVELCLAEIAGKAVLHEKRYVVEWKPAVVEAAVLRDALARLSPAERFLVWSVGALLLPVVLLPVVRSVVRRKSNEANALLLGCLTAADAVGAYLLLGAGVGSALGVMLLLFLTALAFVYNMRIMVFALTRLGA
jgi:hypothetical protein